MSISDGDTVDIEFSDNANLVLGESGTALVTILRSKYLHIYPGGKSQISTYWATNDDNGNPIYSPTPFVLTDSDGDAFKMPIPIENIIVFKQDLSRGNDYYLDNSVTIKRYYPNVYVIEDANATEYSSYRVAYFYYPMDGHYHYTNYLSNVWKLALATFDGYSQEDIVRNLLGGPDNFDSEAEYNKWSILIPYVPPDFEYTVPDFLKDKNKFPFDYKIEKMCEAIRKDPWVLHEYVKAQSHCNYGYELDVSRIRDGLESRRRMDSEGEARFTEHKKNFDVPCYVFNFNIGAKINFELTFFVNGLYVEPVYVFEEFFTKYIYIPCGVVDESSIIDVEENDAYVYEEDIDVTKGDEHRVRVKIPGGSNIHPLMKNIKMRDESGYTLLKSEVQENFEFRKRDGALEFPITDKEYTPITAFTVRHTPTSKDVSTSTRFTIIVDRSNTICDYTSDEDPILVTMMPRTFWDDPERVRVFVNGKLMDRSAVLLTYYDTEHSILLVKKPLKFGDTVNVLLSPNYYEEVFTADSIPENGIVNLAHELNKPVNLTYYDFYLNGTKLTSREIVQLSPAIIQIHDVKSMRHLSIYEKDRDPIEYFGKASGYSDHYEDIQTIEDIILNPNGIWYENRIDLIKILWSAAGYEYPELGVMLFEKEGDFIGNLISDETADMIIYIFKTFFCLSRINPDNKQIDGRHVEDHYDTMHYWLASDSSASAGDENVFRIDPDIIVAGTEVVQPISGDKFYTQYKIDYEKKE